MFVAFGANRKVPNQHLRPEEDTDVGRSVIARAGIDEQQCRLTGELDHLRARQLLVHEPTRPSTHWLQFAPAEQRQLLTVKGEDGGRRQRNIEDDLHGHAHEAADDTGPWRERQLGKEIRREFAGKQLCLVRGRRTRRGRAQQAQRQLAQGGFTASRR